ncbi:MAG TPA: Nif3-like dinuclear metal center hexameric protein [Solirubrobacteraceae bacterium]|nr:Nif3-like dinuclear metal center hexameric protein [Solirubrobacteraceae bacterium]
MPAALTDLIAEADRLLEPGHFEDYCVNGLQVPGPGAVTTIASGVSAHVELFERAAQEHAQLLLVHHGLFWGPGVRTIDAALKRRLEVLFDEDVALAAYHLPLDAHPQLGNNALLARGLGATELEPFARHRGATIGFVAKLPDRAISGEQLAHQVQELTGREPLWFDFGPPRIERLAIVSGAGGDFIPEALAAGAQGLLTGEAPERSMADAREAGIHLFAAGHYATETFGVKALGEHLAERFSLQHVFIDVPNPL